MFLTLLTTMYQLWRLNNMLYEITAWLGLRIQEECVINYNLP